MEEENRKPWHRRDSESSKAFHAFMLYRDMMPAERSIQKVLEICNKKASYYWNLARWSSWYNWVERAKQYDDYIAEIKSQAQIHAIKEMAERQAKEGMALQQFGIEYLRGNTLTKGQDAIRAIEVGTRIERTARGEPTEILQLQGKLKPIIEYTEDELQWTIEHGKPIEAKLLLEKGKG